MPSELVGGSQNTSLGTEIIVATVYTIGNVALHVGLRGTSLGDFIQVTMYESVRQSTGFYPAFQGNFGPQSHSSLPALISPPVDNVFGVQVGVKQWSGGAPRAILWSLRKL